MQTIKDYAGKAGEGLADLGENLSNNPGALNALLAGGGSALLGGWLSSRNKGKDDEDPGERRKRILLNALLAGGAGAGAGYLATQGYKSLAEASPAGTSSELEKAVAGPVPRGLAAGATGAGLYAGGLKKDTQALQRLVGAAFDEKNIGKNPNKLTSSIGNKLETASSQSGGRFNLGGPLRDAVRDIMQDPRKLRTLEGAIGKSEGATSNIGAHGAKELQKTLGYKGTGLLSRVKNPEAVKHLGRVIGRDPRSQALRGTALGAALLYPEIAQGVGGAITG